MVLPTIATLALGTALLVPLRDDRHGKRATVGGIVPLHPDFHAIASRDTSDDESHSKRPRSRHSTEDEPDVCNGDEVGDVVCATASPRPSKRNEGGFPPARAASTTESIDVSGDVLGDSNGVTEPFQEPPKAANSTHLCKRWFDGFLRALWVDKKRKVLGDPNATSHLEDMPNEPALIDGFEAAAAVTIERSFADELEQLLTGHGTDGPNDASHSPVAIMLAASQPVPTAQPDVCGANTTASQQALVPPSKPISAPALASLCDEQVESQAIPENVIAQIRHAKARVVPLTRLPLRPQSQAITWPAELDPAHNECSVAERHAILVAIARESGRPNASILEAALNQEDSAGRLLALRALAELKPTPRTRAAFIEALRVGTDDERTIALDALATHGQRNDLLPGLRDRVDAIAAQAALTYVGSHRRADYEETLLPHIDAARIESILALLAGVVE